MSAPDRETYAARQAQLLDALLRGDEPPAGFDAAQAGAAGGSLRRKRGRQVALAWPALALALALGDGYGVRFDAYARAVDAPPSGDPLADGLGFALSLQRDELTDDARVELLLARAALRRGRGGRWRARRTPFAAAARLGAPRPRTLIVVALPWLGRRYLAIARRARSGPCSATSGGAASAAPG